MIPGMVSFGEEEGFPVEGRKTKKARKSTVGSLARGIWSLSVTEPERKSGTKNMEAESVRSSGTEIWYEEYGG